MKALEKLHLPNFPNVRRILPSWLGGPTPTDKYINALNTIRAFG